MRRVRILSAFFRRERRNDRKRFTMIEEGQDKTSAFSLMLLLRLTCLPELGPTTGKENQSFSLGERALLPYWLAAHTESFLTVYTYTDLKLKASKKQ